MTRQIWCKFLGSNPSQGQGSGLHVPMMCYLSVVVLDKIVKTLITKYTDRLILDTKGNLILPSLGLMKPNERKSCGRSKSTMITCRYLVYDTYNRCT